MPFRIRSVLADNLLALKEARGVGVNRLAADTKVGNGTIQRTLAQETGASIDTVAVLAKALGVEPWMLLVPDLDPRDPWVVIRRSENAARKEERLKAAAWDELQRIAQGLTPESAAGLVAPGDDPGEDEAGADRQPHSDRRS